MNSSQEEMQKLINPANERNGDFAPFECQALPFGSWRSPRINRDPDH
jgi:hypothetical protein